MKLYLLYFWRYFDDECECRSSSGYWTLVGVFDTHLLAVNEAGNRWKPSGILSKIEPQTMNRVFNN